MTLDYSISLNNGYDKDAYTYVPVIIIGAGESGIAMGCRLREKLGFDQFRIFDRQSGMGGMTRVRAPFCKWHLADPSRYLVDKSIPGSCL